VNETYNEQLGAQLTAQLCVEGTSWENTHDDTAGLVILHQQYLLSSDVSLVIILSDFTPILPPFCDEHPATPRMGTVAPPVVHDAFQSSLLSSVLAVHVVDEFNATHFVAAYIGVT